MRRFLRPGTAAADVTDLTRGAWLEEVAARGAGAAIVGASAPAHASDQAAADSPDGSIVARTSTSDVFVPPRGRSFQKFSFDFPEPSVQFGGYEFGFRVFTHENTYGLS